MSYRVPEGQSVEAGSSRRPLSDSSDSDDDDRASDWVSELGEAAHTKSLFDDQVFDSPELALAHDASAHSYDLKAEISRLQLDFYGKMRLVNLIRTERLSPEAARALRSDTAGFSDDAYLIPAITDDPFLRQEFLLSQAVADEAGLDLDEDWSEDELEPAQPRAAAATTSETSSRTLKLEAELEQARKELARMQTLLKTTMDDGSDSEISPISSQAKGKGKAEERDDDTHYFDSYSHNDIHEIMLKDTVRTMSYAKFILSNPKVFRGATVMDVGCGTGILTMFAARAGAAKVYAIEASALADKARENIRKNGFEDVITVVQGKVENISLDVKVDVIISEWMGYMLLYESMLDSVLNARDRFLRPNGLMAPSQTRLAITAITGERLYRDQIDFWRSVYGFDMSTMNQTYFQDGLTEFVDPAEIVSDECIVADVNSHTATVASLDFRSTFSIAATTSRSVTVRALLTHFDTFFSPLSGEASHFGPDHAVQLERFDGADIAQPIAGTDSDNGVEVSFTTGPRGKDTHWKQVAFLLREPLALQPNERISGTFSCRKSATNSRELDVEIHYTVHAASDGAAIPAGALMSVQSWKVR